MENKISRKFNIFAVILALLAFLILPELSIVSWPIYTPIGILCYGAISVGVYVVVRLLWAVINTQARDKE
ncbi:hypothetical protein ACVG8M_004039, partial [Morganella morganii]